MQCPALSQAHSVMGNVGWLQKQSSPRRGFPNSPKFTNSATKTKSTQKSLREAQKMFRSVSHYNHLQELGNDSTRVRSEGLRGGRRGNGTDL